jgi:hypothetical protein
MIQGEWRKSNPIRCLNTRFFSGVTIPQLGAPPPTADRGNTPYHKHIRDHGRHESEPWNTSCSNRTSRQMFDLLLAGNVQDRSFQHRRETK